MFELIIFDFNGTVLNDEPVWAEAFGIVFENHGGNDAAFHHQPGIGISGNWQHLQQQYQELASVSIEELRAETLEAYVEIIADNGEYRNGFQSFTELLEREGLPYVLATSLDRDILERTLTYFPGLEEKFDVVVAGDDVPEKKPAPDIFLKVLEKYNSTHTKDFDEEACLVFEDSQAGVMAALNANMHVVYLPNESVEPSETELDPDLIVGDFTDEKIIDFVLGGEE